MTRINAGIQVETLTDKHLIAEHREIKRIPNCIKKGRYNMKGQPEEFTLGTGHIKFFYDKCGYLLDRYINLYDECKKRGFNVQNYIESWQDIPDELMGYYKPTKKAIEEVTERINERLSN
jgi:hypothetical protein